MVSWRKQSLHLGTAEMLPAQGRASYLGERVRGIPDGGAVAVVCWLEALEPVITG